MRDRSFGFVAAVAMADLTRLPACRRGSTESWSSVAGDGVTVDVRAWASTPESIGEVQPRVSAELILAYEGRVDNRHEIAYMLGRPHLAGAPDGEVLAAAYDAWADRLAGRVIGEYSYVVIDLCRRRSSAGHEALGVRRLYFCARDGRIWIASSLPLLFERYPDVRPSIDRDVLPEYFAATMSPTSGRTIWSGIRELGSGSVLVHDGARVSEERVWSPTNGRTVRCRSADEADEAFRQILFDGVNHARRAVGPLLCDLSGGFDSSAVCSVAALLHQADPSGSSIIGWTCRNPRANEREYQEAVTAQFGIDTEVVDISTHLPFQVLDAAELPSGGLIQTGALYRAMRTYAAAKGIRSRLTGFGADALLQTGLSSPLYLAEWLRAGRLRAWARDLRAHLQTGAFNAWHLLRDCTIGTVDMHAATFRAPLPDWLTPRFREQIRAAEHVFRRQERSCSSDARERIYRSTLCFIPEHGRMLADERMPLIYRPMVEFILGLDWEYLTRPGEERLLMRRALRGILPERVRDGGTHGRHGAPIYEGLRREWLRIAPLISGERLAELGVIDLQRFQTAVEKMRTGYPGPNVQVSNTALYLETWLNLKAGVASPHPASSPRINAA